MPSSDLSLVSPFLHSNLSVVQIARLFQAIVELREQSLVAGENTLRLRGENVELRHNLEDMWRHGSPLVPRGHGKVGMDLECLRAHSLPSLKDLKQQLLNLDLRLEPLEYTMRRATVEGRRQDEGTTNAEQGWSV
ncbi:hypothetical protein GLOTRDRAFT_128305 [Gloeophyllum trabeum ATCC 11539]|uniref:Uncharacterized protein n=1 Tax=Gloeophyllum trabeum (strain ATCC 11539 / FP-39264 / Madison 617) TaxID=670483 RepID=S7RP97_GLOTA|nr:uncharacterized protein GLOTRDRAFT_128305 [Gloeophyllum trabeum ATCC 11539]EPQ56360.1 hypothetical protein GLOTRDRAFT_128305 [Gloeophyllum trabeum ATCC 11539]